MVVETILTGITAGVLYSLAMYSKKQGQKFEIKKFMTTIGVGALSGVLMCYANMPLEQGQELLIQIGAVSILENILKIIHRKFVPTLLTKMGR